VVTGSVYDFKDYYTNEEYYFNDYAHMAMKICETEVHAITTYIHIHELGG
jgi:hypothetical protein